MYLTVVFEMVAIACEVSIHKVSKLEKETESVLYHACCVLFKALDEDQRFCCHDNSVCVL